ncbi:hypothetical protein EMCG_01720 [[Emmonsia] crescens]|uniref:Uncharacterized protein n=1 Tax=[Emmonsia] crescens TaxID=73230 RepID=A0A0G2J9H0_9EURO|nr:hypothetical protein EMCG_01720 [Emmonsia crescens UAMH 3008]
MKSVTVALKASNTSITVIKKVNLEIEKIKLNIKRVRLNIEKQKIITEKERIIIERAKMNIENTKLAVQCKILRLINTHYESQKEFISNLTRLTTDINIKTYQLCLEMYEMISKFEMFAKHLIKTEDSSDNEKFSNSNNNDKASDHLKTSTLKQYMIDDSVSQIMTNSETLIHRFSDMINESDMTENENYERNLIQVIKKNLCRSMSDFQ